MGKYKVCPKCKDTKVVTINDKEVPCRKCKDK